MAFSFQINIYVTSNPSLQGNHALKSSQCPRDSSEVCLQYRCGELLPRGRRKHSLGWTEDILKELLDLVDVSFDLTVEGDEGRMRAGGQVLEVCRLPGRHSRQL